ncbi:hypothetical protein [Myxacorys almedinensis]|uniref:Uncharacterized protein n=1 Tax=Myxacorys almedinensis A TaxID=2690445 RepID=A0A8J7YZK9_9CYAN|nr:hypothetical protein [Myxacorys almedinensis]NDJ17437.1 hypothetical protein [Myxacorys almedinensis A]
MAGSRTLRGAKLTIAPSQVPDHNLHHLAPKPSLGITSTRWARAVDSLDRFGAASLAGN